MTANITIHTIAQQTIWERAAEFLMNSFKTHKDEKTLFLLSGGSAVKLYGKLAEYIKSADINPDSLAIGQIDERFHPENPKYEIRNTNKNLNINSYVIKQTGLWEACKMKNIPYYLVSQEGTLEDAAEKYNRQMGELFKIFTYKIGILGIGEDGHTAGLLPGYKSAWDKKQLALGYENKGRFPSRITLTPNSLEQLDQTIVVVSGEGKRIAIKNAFDPANMDNPDKYPAVIIQKIKKVDLFTDLTL